MSDATTADELTESRRREARLLQLGFGFLLLVALALAFPRPMGGAVRIDQLALLPVWAGSAWVIRRFADRGNPRRDPLVFPVIWLLAGWGGLVVWRISPQLGVRQLGWMLVASVVLVEMLRRPSDLGWLRRYRYVWLTAGLAVTASTLVFGTNPAGGGPRLWLGCCGLYFQPSEPLRLLLVVFTASYLAERRLANVQRVWAADFVPLMAAAGLAGALLLAQRDLGAGLLLLALLAGQIYVAYGHAAAVYGGVALLGVGAGAGALTLEFVRDRFAAWVNPWLDPTGTGYQIVQSLIAIASGGLLGAGPGRGTPTAVPVVHSDFVFAAIAEEWGLAGALAMVGLCAVLVGRGMRTAACARDPFAVLLGVGASLALGFQALLIMAGVVRVLPITGVTLPFVSYGGSSLVTSAIAASVLLVLSNDRRVGQGPYGHSVRRVQTFLSIGWVAIALALGWWSLVRSEGLVARTDNPRRAIASRLTQRGSIFDWNGIELTASVGPQGAYERVYRDPSTVPVTGYDSATYGQAGLESTMDPYLRGELGLDPVAVWWSKLVTGRPPPGVHVRLTLDSELQQAAAAGLAGRSGAVVVVDARSGDILAMASAPSFDPNRLEQDWQDLISRTDAPLLNRAAQARYQPGMTLAPLLYAWGSANGWIEPWLPAPEFDRPVRVLDRSIGCEREPQPETDATWENALGLGCPGPFAALGKQMGSEALRVALTEFGLLTAPDILLPVAPTTEILELGDPGLLAIGQGELTTTPLQLAQALSVLTGVGVRPDLRLVAGVGPTPGDWQTLLALETAEPILPAVEGQHAIDPLPQYGGGLKGYEVNAASGEGSLGWFAGFGPGDEVVVVLLEGSPASLARELGVRVLQLAIDLDLTTRGG